MKQTETTILKITLRGIRPLMFDRYPGDNKTSLEPLEKLYVNEKGICILPMLNMYSLLSAQNTPSVAKRFYGKAARDIALGVQAFVNIEADSEDPVNAPILDENLKPYHQDDPRIKILSHVARLDKGIPNPKRRPIIPTGWRVKLKIEHQSGQSHVTIDTLKKMLDQGGVIGLGTFRPIFGRFVVEED